MISQEESLALNKKYTTVRELYLNNAHKFLNKKRFQKASEFFWGASSQAIKSHAILVTGRKIVKHNEMRNYIKQLAVEKEDELLKEEFEAIERLHANFYEEFIKEKDFPSYITIVEKFISKIEEYTPI